VAKWSIDFDLEFAMKAAFRALLLCFVSLGACAAAPTSESLERLLKDVDAEKTVSSVQQYADAMMKGSMDRVYQLRKMTPEQHDKLEAFRAKMASTMQEELSWEKMKPVYLQLYGENFSQDEIDGLIAFYESPAGRAFIAKMPVVLQKSMDLSQQRIGSLMQRMQGAIKETLEEK
jgi:uncharacterized protein